MKKPLLLIFIFLSTNSFSQKPAQDAGMWFTASINKKLTRNLTVGLDQELRLFDNVSRVNQIFTNVGLSYRLRSVKFAVAYRFINKNEDDEYYSEWHRVYVEGSYRYKLNNWALLYRLRLQGQVGEINSSETGRYIESYLRHKFDLSYSLDKFTPYTAVEFRYLINDPNFPEGNKSINRMSYYLGLDYDFNRMHAIGVYYLILHEQNVRRPEESFIVGLQYSLNL